MRSGLREGEQLTLTDVLFPAEGMAVSSIDVEEIASLWPNYSSITLTTATIMVTFVIPAFYMVLHDAGLFHRHEELTALGST